MTFEVKTEFSDLEAAIAYLKGGVTTAIRGLESAESELTGEKGKLIAKRDELLSELKVTKEKYAKFKGHEDVDVDELLRIKEQASGDESEVEAKYRKAYEADQKKFNDRLATLEKEREVEKQQAEQDKKKRAQAQLQAETIAEFAKPQHKIINPAQFWKLYGKGNVQTDPDTGKKFVEVDYKKMDLPSYISYLADDTENQHNFRASGHSGSGGGPGKQGGGKQKKWSEMNLTERTRLIKSNPDGAKKLAGESGVTL